MAYRDLEECLIDSSSNSSDEVSSNHIPHGLHLSLPHGSRKHDKGCDDVNRSTTNAESKRDEDDAADRQACHVGCVSVVESVVAHAELFVKVLPHWDADAETGNRVNCE